MLRWLILFLLDFFFGLFLDLCRSLRKQFSLVHFLPHSSALPGEVHVLLEEGFRADGSSHGFDLLFSDPDLLRVDEMVELLLQLGAIVAVVRLALWLEPFQLLLTHKAEVALLAHEQIVIFTQSFGCRRFQEQDFTLLPLMVELFDGLVGEGVERVLIDLGVDEIFLLQLVISMHKDAHVGYDLLFRL